MKRICLGAIFALVMSLPMCSYTQEPKHTPGATGQEQPKQPEVAPQAQSPPSQKEAKPPKATAPKPARANGSRLTKSTPRHLRNSRPVHLQKALIFPMQSSRPISVRNMHSQS